MTRALCALSMALLLSACVGAQPWDRAFYTGHTRLERLAASSWRADTIEGKPAKSALLIFASDGRLSGSSGCNRLFGTAAVNGSSIRFSDVEATKVMCAGDAMTEESAFFDALGKTRTYSIGWNGELYLAGDHGQTLAKFTPVKAVR